MRLLPCLLFRRFANAPPWLENRAISADPVRLEGDAVVSWSKSIRWRR
ncbi:hypothetical protein ACFOGG_10910 [Brenneria rubrifaciens]